MATDVFYSVCPFGTGDLKTGSPTITISDGVATLSVAQTGNIGQGCRITYGGGSSSCYISRVNSPTSYNVITATGGVPGDVSGQAVNSIAHEYASTSAAMTGASDANHLNTNDLAIADVILNLPCYYDHDDYTPYGFIVTNGYIADSEHYINWYTPQGGTESLYNQRGDFSSWDPSKVCLSVNGYYVDDSLFRIYVPYTRITGFQGEQTYSTMNYAFLVYLYAGATGCVISGNFLRFTGYPFSGIEIQNLNDADITIANNIIVGASYGLYANHLYDTGYTIRGVIANNTISGSTQYGLHVRYSAGSSSLVVRNNVAIGSATGDFYLVNVAGDHNASSDGTAPGTGSITNQLAADLFVDPANHDYRPKAGSPLISAGIGPALDANVPLFDIAGNPRSGNTCSIGAFEFVDEGGTLSIPVAMHHYNLLRSA